MERVTRITDVPSVWDFLFLSAMLVLFGYTLMKLADALQASGRSRWLVLIPMLAVFVLLMDKLRDDR